MPPNIMRSFLITNKSPFSNEGKFVIVLFFKQIMRKANLLMAIYILTGALFPYFALFATVRVHASVPIEELHTRKLVCT